MFLLILSGHALTQAFDSMLTLVICSIFVQLSFSIQVILIGNIEPIDYIVGVLFLTETNRYFKQNKINSHGYYLAYTFINLFYKIRQRMFKTYKFELNDISHFILCLSNNVDYFNLRIDPTNNIKNKININLSKFQVEIIPILINLIKYNKIHLDKEELSEQNKNMISNIDSSETSIKNSKINNIITEHTINIDNKNLIIKKDLSNKKIIKKINKLKNENRFCNIECYSCWVTNILSKFFYLLLQTAKFLGSGTYSDPNLVRLSEYYANIFYTWFKSYDIHFLNYIGQNELTELYENYLNYKNKLNYSLIELNLNSETLDEIIDYIDNEIIKNLSIKLK
jgi:hypothetical protein